MDCESVVVISRCRDYLLSSLSWLQHCCWVGFPCGPEILPLSVIHSSAPALFTSPQAWDNTWTIIPPYCKFLSQWLNLQSKFQVSREAYCGGVFSGGWWSQLLSVLSLGMILPGDRCMSSCFFTRFATVGIFGCISQVLAISPSTSCGVVTPFCAYLMAKSLCGLTVSEAGIVMLKSIHQAYKLLFFLN